MIATSLQDDGPDPLGRNLLHYPHPTRVGRVGASLVQRVHRPRVQGHPGRLLELGADRRAQYCLSILGRRRQWLCIGFLAAARAGGLFAVLLVGAFIPYQVFLYPLVRGLAFFQLFGSLTGIVLVRTVFGMPVMTLLFRNYYRCRRSCSRRRG